MLPIHHIFQDIKSAFGTDMVGLPLPGNADTRLPIQDSFDIDHHSSTQPSSILLASALPTRTLTGLLVQRKESETQEDLRGPFGLNLLYAPPEPIVDFIFVHGLSGGSRKTWSKSRDPSTFWPRAWLPYDKGFGHVRIHTFGYDADWNERGQQAFNILHFGKSLMTAVSDNVHLSRDVDSPIVLVGHSTGGLVIRQMVTASQQDPAFQHLGGRIKAIFFLGTPHKSANVAQILSNIVRESAQGSKPSIKDMQKNSPFLTRADDTFRRCVEDVLLFSFYETKPTSLVIGSDIIVERDSRTLGYPQERTIPLDCDHHGLCRFDSAGDPSYIKIRETFLSVVHPIEAQWLQGRHHQLDPEKLQLGKFLDIHEIPEDYLAHFVEQRTEGSCEWLIDSDNFRQWRDGSGPKLFWLHASPGTGKSVLAARVVEHLQEANLSCSYFFFNHGEKIKSTLATLLRSMAYQMALTYVGVKNAILGLHQDLPLDKDDHRSIWRQLFQHGILQEELPQPQYWVIDALDECGNYADLIPMLSKIEGLFPLRILLTSRSGTEIDRTLQQRGTPITVEAVSRQVVDKDIKLYVTSNTHHLPGSHDFRRALVTTILEKANGSFLWAMLVVQELGTVHTIYEVREVLESVPVGMENLYERILQARLQTMSSKPNDLNLAKAILRWTVCAARPLSIDELGAAVKLEIRANVLHLEKAIVSLCDQLVYVDSQKPGRVQMIHQTAKDFLLDPELKSELAIRKDDGNRILAEVCLTYLADDEMRAPRARALSIAKLGVIRSPFAAYASSCFYHHLAAANSEDDKILNKLGAFLRSSNVLTWIEINAQNGSLGNLIGAAKVLKSYLQRRAKHTAPIGREVQVIDNWSTDLIRIVAKFGSSLLLSPSSIYRLIPPFCPPDTAPYRQFVKSFRGISVTGLSSKGWDDWVSCITFGSNRTTAIACDDNYFAIGFALGTVMIYHRTTCQLYKSRTLGERVKVLVFSASSKLLGCCGLRQVRVWNVASGEVVFAAQTTAQLLALIFMENDQTLMGAAKDNQLLSWDLGSVKLHRRINWNESIDHETSNLYRVPTVAAFSPELQLLGIVYRGQPVMIWDLENDIVLCYCGKTTNGGTGRYAIHTAVVDLVFNPIPAVNRLAAAYQDGDLVLLDPLEGIIIETVVAEAQILACSPDGRTLATGNASGTIQLYDFETLRLMYRINSWGHGINSLAFSYDSLQLVDIRGSQCNVWEPSILVRQNASEEHNDNSTDSGYASMTEISSSMVEELLSITITTIVSHPTLDFIFCGRDDGSVGVYEALSGELRKELYSHIEGIAITFMAFQGDCVFSVDSSSRILGYTITGTTQQIQCQGPIVEFQLEQPITHILLNSSLTSIFISSLDTDAIYTMDGKILHSMSQTSDARRWCSHPKDSTKLICVTGNTLRFHTWDDLRPDASTLGHVLTTDLPDTLRPHTVTQLPGMDFIAVKFADVRGNRSSARTTLIDMSSLDEGPTRNRVIHDQSNLNRHEALATIIEHIVGYIGTRVIFLDQNGWICSTDLKSSAKEYSLRHFFIPSDWLSINPNLICLLTAGNNLAFVQRNEIAIVKRGFDYSEKVMLQRERAPALHERSST